ncbi:MAG TPA: GNAT family N-acetyltransferase [Casimicrobiaceae bacterium]|nr:GNAT family N-acetyltransferase [Casimicrobiaceae bacterium]
MTPADEVLVARASAADVPELHRMIRALAEFEKLAHLCTGSEDELGAALGADPPHVEALIARIGPEAVGFALFFHTFSTFLARRGLWLEDLFVLPAARGRGVGKALLRAVAGVAAERGCGRFEWSVLDWNTPAIRFYEGLGAAVLPDWRIARVTGDGIARLAAGATRSA